MDIRRTAAASAVVLAAADSAVALRAVVVERDACERYRTVAEDVERSERGKGGLSFPEAQQELATAFAACLQQEEADGR